MIGGMTRQGGLPGLPDRVTLSAGVKFCHVNVQGGVTPLAGVGFKFAQNSLWRWLCIIIKATALKVAARAASECRRALIAKARGLPALFLCTYLATIQ